MTRGRSNTLSLFTKENGYAEDEGASQSAARRTVPSGKLGPWELNAVHHANCLDGMKRLPDDCLDVAVTSPPYWGQRGNDGIGLEEDPRDYVRNLTETLAEAMRCLKPSGTLWLNIGDSYNTPINWREEDYVHSSLGADGNGLPAANSAYTKNRGRRRAFIRKDAAWLQYGNLLALPSRVVIAMCDLGFLLRGEIIWEKSRPLPEGLCRRPHRRHEAIYVFAKSEGHAFQVKPSVGSVWKLTQTPNTTPHCSTFPIDLPMRCIEAAGLTEPGVVLDPFMGSGTTGKAALRLGHSFLGFEQNPETCRLANDFIAGLRSDKSEEEAAQQPRLVLGQRDAGKVETRILPCKRACDKG